MTLLPLGCIADNDEGETEQHTEPLPPETAEGFTDFSDVRLPDGPEKPEISVERNRNEEPRYRIT